MRLFAHRGFVEENIAENSLPSLIKAHQLGFRAIEFDLWFFNEELLLKHDRPLVCEFKSLATLKNYFCFGNEMTYWLDFKNLSENNVFQVLRLLEKYLNEASINLDQIYFAPFIVCHQIAAKIFGKIREVFGQKTQVMAVCEELKNSTEIENLRQFLSQNSIKFLSIFHRLIDENFMEIFNDTEIFAWTVNDSKRLHELEVLKVKNFATDKICPLFPRDAEKRHESCPASLGNLIPYVGGTYR